MSAGSVLPRRSFLLRRAHLVALALALGLGLAGIFQHGLWTPDEPREAEIGREMLLSGLSPLPTLGGAPFVEKPPLFPWAMALAYRVFGVSPGTARLPAVLFSIGALLVAFELGRRAGGRLAGLCAALALATGVKFAEVSHASVNDTALTFFVGAGHLAFLSARDDHRLGRRSLALPLVGLLAGFAFLTKAFIGPVLLIGPPILAAAVLREWAFLRHALARAALWCPVFVALLGVPWIFALVRTAGWEPVRVCLIDNTIGRAMGGGAYATYGHARGPLDYLATFPVSFLPWTLAIPAALAGGTLSGGWRAGRARTLALVALAGLVLLSIPSGKRDLYALPLFPAAAVVPGVWLSRVGSRRGSRFDRATLWALLALPVLAWLSAAAALAAVASHRVPRGALELALAIEQRFGSGLLSFVAVMLAIGALATATLLLLARRLPTGRVAFRAAAVLSLFTLVFHAGLRPLIDPIKDLRAGSLEIARAVPAGEPLLGFALDETTRAVVPFYTGRILRDVDRPELALAELEAGPSRHLLVMESAEQKLPEEERRRLRPVASVRLSATRSVTLYRYEAGG